MHRPSVGAKHVPAIFVRASVTHTVYHPLQPYQGLPQYPALIILQLPTAWLLLVLTPCWEHRVICLAQSGSCSCEVLHM